MKLVVGLGNPGKEYENTRHNIGFMVLDYFLNSNDWKKKFDGFYQIQSFGLEKVIFLKPTTYMNLSGNSVLKVKNFYNISLEDILIIQDDIDLSFGTYKIKKNSSSGGHNGIKSIIQSLGSDRFARLKIGIAHSKTSDSIGHVLGKFSKEELLIINNYYSIYQKIIDSFINQGIDYTMNHYRDWEK